MTMRDYECKRQFAALAMDTHGRQIAVKNQTEKEPALRLTSCSKRLKAGREVSAQLAGLPMHPFQEISASKHGIKQ